MYTIDSVVSPVNEGSSLKCNYKNKMDGLMLLDGIRDNSIRISFFDPQYRGVFVRKVVLWQ